jgi:hypothetical protein
MALSALFLLWALLFSDTSVPVALTVHGYARTVLTKRARRTSCCKTWA